MKSEIKRLQRDAEMISRFAIALFRTGHEARAREYAQMAEGLWLRWAAMKEAKGASPIPLPVARAQEVRV